MELELRLQQVMQQAVDEHLIAGMNLLAERDGEEVCYCQAGMADIGKGRAFERNTIFRLYSQSKPITAAAAMILMERGMLDLQQPVSDFLPSFERMRYLTPEGVKEAVRPVFVRDLLNMTSGLVYPNEESEAGRYAGAVFEEACARLHTDNPMTTLELADALAKGPLEYEPGSSFQYGTSADVLGAVIEVVCGMRFGAFLQKEIFDPLGMEDTAFWVPAEKRDRFAAAYETVVNADRTKSIVRYDGDNLAIRNDMSQPPAYEAGGAGLVSTLDDYMRFARMLQREGELDGARILQPATVRFMTGGQLMDYQQKAFEKWIGLDGYSYSNLMRVCKNPAQASFLTAQGEYGWDGWLGAYFANFPAENMTILMGTQKRDAGTFALTRKLRNVILSSL